MSTDETVKIRPASVSTGILAASVSLIQRFRPTNEGAIATKIILRAYVNIKSKARRFDKARNRRVADPREILALRISADERLWPSVRSRPA
jgi:hypothetical protein